MKLVRVVNCLKLLNWETHLPAGCPIDAWVDRLCDRGGVRVSSRIPGLTQVRFNGHNVLIVERSGRVSIRLDYAVEHLERRHAAEEVFVWLVDAVRRAN